MEYLPSKRKCGNQVHIASCVLAHTLSREMQILAITPRPVDEHTEPNVSRVSSGDRYATQVADPADRPADSPGGQTRTDDVEELADPARLHADAEGTDDDSMAVWIATMG